MSEPVGLLHKRTFRRILSLHSASLRNRKHRLLRRKTNLTI